MRIAVLTTGSVPHARFVSGLAERHEIAGILVETTVPAATFDTAHAYEKDRDTFECKAWFGDSPPALGDLAPVAAFPSLSAPEAADHLKSLNADMGFVLGTRRLAGPILEVMGRRFFNLHGAEPQDYRGVDPNLWAIYHSDFTSLVATAHHLEPRVNTGAVIARQAIALRHGMGLHELRHARTEAMLSVAEQAAMAVSGQTMMMVTPLQRLGRWYGFMPCTLKTVCVDRFRRHTETLP